MLNAEFQKKKINPPTNTQRNNSIAQIDYIFINKMGMVIMRHTPLLREYTPITQLSRQ